MLNNILARVKDVEFMALPAEESEEFSQYKGCPAVHHKLTAIVQST
jgi:hypothetical protein